MRTITQLPQTTSFIRGGFAQLSARFPPHTLDLVTLVLLLGPGTLSVGAEEATAREPSNPASSAPYDLVTSHLCGDREYLSCLQVSADRCRAELDQEPVRACGGTADFAVLSYPPEARGNVVPRGLVECIYTAHIELRGLPADEVNRCMGDAKLRSGDPEPAILYDAPGD